MSFVHVSYSVARWRVSPRISSQTSLPTCFLPNSIGIDVAFDQLELYELDHTWYSVFTGVSKLVNREGAR